MSIFGQSSPSANKHSEEKRLELPSTGGLFSENRSLKAIWINQDLEPVSKLILLSLARRCPSQEIFSDKIILTVKAICEETNSSHQTVATHLKKLQEQGYIVIENLSHKKREYKFTEKLFSDYEADLLLKGVEAAEAKLKKMECAPSPDDFRILKGISSSEKLMLLWLAAQCKITKFLVPHIHRQEEMSFQMGLSKNSLTRVIQKLELEGVLHVIRTIRRPNVYALDESLFLSSKAIDAPLVLNNDSKNEGHVQKDLHDRSNIQTKDSHFTGEDLQLCCCRRAERDAQQKPQSSMVLRSIGEENRTYSLYPNKEESFVFEEEEKPEKEAFGIAKILLTSNKEDISLCSLTTRELSKSILEMFGLRVLREAKKICFQYRYFGMGFHKLHWICEEIHERRNPFHEPEGEEAQRALVAQRKQREEQSKRLEEEIQRKYIAAQYRGKEQQALNATPAISPLEVFKQTLMNICLKYYSGPEDRLLDSLNRMPAITFRLFKNEYERLPRERFETYMKTWVGNQFGRSFK